MLKKETPLCTTNLIGRLNQVHHTPVYDVTKRQTVTNNGDWFESLVDNYKSEKYKEPDETEEAFAPSSLGIRHPPPIIKPKSMDASGQQRYTSTQRENNGAIKFVDKEIKFKVMEVNTKSKNNTPASSLHLPQVMKSFLPSVSRKSRLPPPLPSRSSWVDLTSQTKIKQVIPRHYKQGISRPRVTLFAVNYESNSSKRLRRRPLPPLKEDSEINSLHRYPAVADAATDTAPIHLPALSKTSKTRNSRHVAIETIQETKVRAFNTLIERLEKTRQLNFPAQQPNKPAYSNQKLVYGNQIERLEGQKRGRHENGSSKVIRSRQRVASENDRHFGGVRGGVTFNKLPSDLIGNVQSNFNNLEYYLGRVNPSRLIDDHVVYIPTGRSEETPFGVNLPIVYEDKHGVNGDVKIKYSHRGADDTPPLDTPPWEDNLDQKASKHEGSCRDRPTADVKPVKHVTISIPRVPPPSPETQSNRPKSRERRRRANQKPCRHCKEEEKGVALPEIPTKLPSIADKLGAESAPEQSHDSLTRCALTVTERRSKMIDKLVNAHGDMKRRHKCPQKEVIIAPFKVVIDERDTKPNAVMHDTKLRPARSTITKPFTFSYLPSKNRKSKKLPPEKDKDVVPPEIYNYTPAPLPGRKSSIISSFVAVNQSKQIYEALIGEKTSVGKKQQSLNKSTNCENIDDLINQRKVKGRDLSLLPQQSKQLLTV